MTRPYLNPKRCRIMAFWAMFRVLGAIILPTVGVQVNPDPRFNQILWVWRGVRVEIVLRFEGVVAGSPEGSGCFRASALQR